MSALVVMLRRWYGTTADTSVSFARWQQGEQTVAEVGVVSVSIRWALKVQYVRTIV